ncbi:unnamed protein product [Mycena citricolor]|uniref:Membrane-associated proteins in eicosanoid and glutathione metabolism n=1 Tax=Mycena citricolor TaxID=2018698 RepID=A0AAD2Q5H1_9AGAR|nr:unnamed protein product [Mycena citricolor]
MTSTITVPTGFSWVAAALASTTILLMGQSITVSKHRAAAGIAYPQLYADKEEASKNPLAHKFNCVQRAHQNTIENIAQVYMMTLVLSLTSPRAAATGLGLWIVSRVAYTVGYASGKPENRNNIFNMGTYLPGLLTLLGGSIYSAYTLVAAGI